MACSVRDRVEVAWQGSFYHATVVRVHSTGKCDVKYDVDASVGTYLTHKQHGLKVLPVLETDDEEVEITERNDAPCDLPPPPQTDRGDRIPRGVVSPLEFKHKRRGNGSKQRLCLFNNCKSGALKHGLCYRHGAFGVCTSNGCKTNASSVRGLCRKHGSPRSTKRGCNSVEIARRLCRKHGAFGQCNRSGCKSSACGAGRRCSKHVRWGNLQRRVR